MGRRRFTLITALLLLATACGGGAGQQSAQDQLPQITLDSIGKDLDGRWVKVPAADGKSKPLDPWVFRGDEPKEIKILEQKQEGEAATFLVDISTRSAPKSKTQYSLSGQLRLHYELQSGLVMREWQIERVENVSFTYVNETPTPDANANANEGDSDGGPKTDAGANANSNANADHRAKPKDGAPPRANANSTRTGRDD
jgi:hypothetical protein